jgi:hypothetical protein
MTSIRERYARIIDEEAFEIGPYPPWGAEERRAEAYRKADAIISEPGGVGELVEALSRVDRWINTSVPAGTESATFMLGVIRTAIARAGLDGQDKASENSSLRPALHGDQGPSVAESGGTALPKSDSAEGH